MKIETTSRGAGGAWQTGFLNRGSQPARYRPRNKRSPLARRRLRVLPNPSGFKTELKREKSASRAHREPIKRSLCVGHKAMGMRKRIPRCVEILQAK
ncbi:hypothetical protein KCP73_16130 [Salmonella enterica subsp. enterica]|nr:hypothetical protein KCP73_16130 [Salmonella enterica subsp. enterica]